MATVWRLLTRIACNASLLVYGTLFFLREREVVLFVLEWIECEVLFSWSEMHRSWTMERAQNTQNACQFAWRMTINLLIAINWLSCLLWSSITGTYNRNRNRLYSQRYLKRIQSDRYEYNLWWIKIRWLLTGVSNDYHNTISLDYSFLAKRCLLYQAIFSRDLFVFIPCNLSIIFPHKMASKTLLTDWLNEFASKPS